MAVIAASCCFYCCVTLDLWLAVVEEVFSGVIEDHKNRGGHHSVWELGCLGWSSVSTPLRYDADPVAA
ncbi:hypothetical protein F3K52_23085 [Pseudomonas lactis]|jgi:hypothetical protein|nr:hypothetical protein F3K52_23085 [Pseudomonas lactis]